LNGRDVRQSRPLLQLGARLLGAARYRLEREHHVLAPNVTALSAKRAVFSATPSAERPKPKNASVAAWAMPEIVPTCKPNIFQSLMPVRAVGWSLAEWHPHGQGRLDLVRGAGHLVEESPLELEGLHYRRLPVSCPR